MDLLDATQALLDGLIWHEDQMGNQVAIVRLGLIEDLEIAAEAARQFVDNAVDMETAARS